MFNKNAINRQRVLVIGSLFGVLFLTVGLTSARTVGGAPALGNYTNTSVNTAGSLIIQPSAAPLNVGRATATTSTSFKGMITVDPATGAVRVTNAYPAGNYMVTLHGYDPTGAASTSKTFVLNVSPSCGCSGGNFFLPKAPSSSVFVGTSAEQSILRDLNGDGKDDIVTGSIGTVPIGVSLGHGDGTFTSVAFEINPMTQTFEVAAADINNDGKPDIVAAGDDGAEATLDLYYGNGDGTFAAAVTLSLPGNNTLRHVALIDLNNDSLPEIIAGRGAPQNGVLVLVNQGGGSFAAPQLYAAGVGVQELVTGNFNNDNFKDIVIPASSTVYLLTNNGDATFSSPQAITTGNNIFTVAAADLNGDGKADLAVGGGTTLPMKTLFGNGNGTFVPGAAYDIDSTVRRMIATDLNGDGRPDLAVTRTAPSTSDTNTLITLINKGDGTFYPMPPMLPGGHGRGLAASKLDGDNRTDLVVLDSDRSTAAVLLGNGAGEFNRLPRYIMPETPVSTQHYTLAIGDFNNDGRQDVAAGNQQSVFAVSVFMHIGTDSFGAPVNLPLSGVPRSITTADFNGDGNLDIAAGIATGSTMWIILGNGNGTFQPAVGVAVGTRPKAIAKGDFNGDGRADLLVANQISESMSVLLGNGDGTFAVTTIPMQTGFDPRRLEVGDYNEDGKQDFIIIDLGVQSAVWLGSGTGTFTLSSSLSNAFTPAGVTADFNNDNHQDLIAGDFISYFAGIGNGSFADPVVLDSLSYLIAADAADFDGDGHMDILFDREPPPFPPPGEPTGTARLRFGNGDGTFGPQVPFTEWESGGLIVADVNSDGKEDFISANGPLKSLGVYLQQCTVSFSRDALPDGLINQGYSQTVDLKGGAQPYNVNVTGLPAGLNYTLSGNSVVVSGTPLVSGNFNVRISVTDSTPLAVKPGPARPMAANQAFQILPLRVLAPTAAEVSVSGRVLTAGGTPVAKATVLLTDAGGVTRQTLTGPFGTYRFENVPAGESYILQVQSKKYTFMPQTVFVSDEITGLDLTAIDDH